jgi:competence protein ComEC
MIVVNPWIYRDVGWRMSVLSVMTLASISSLDIAPWAKYLAASPAVWLATSVQAAWAFGAVPLSGAVINFFAVPVFAFLLPVAAFLSLPAVAGFKIGRLPAAIAEASFALWERFSNNVTFLVPWKVDFSAPLLASGVAVLSFLFARACGFTRPRAIAVLGAVMFFVFFHIM